MSAIIIPTRHGIPRLGSNRPGIVRHTKAWHGEKAGFRSAFSLVDEIVSAWVEDNYEEPDTNIEGESEEEEDE